MSRTFLAAIFDLDGVITDTASAHARAWKQIVDPLVAEPFDLKVDYLRYVAGRPRLEGIRDFLSSRNIELTNTELIKISDEKNSLYLASLVRDGVTINSEMVARMAFYKSSGMKIAIASSSKNAKKVLEAANLCYNDLLVDGCDVEVLNLKPKPAPDIFIYAAKIMGIAMEHCIIFEDSALALADIAPAHGVLVGMK